MKNERGCQLSPARAFCISTALIRGEGCDQKRKTKKKESACRASRACVPAAVSRPAAAANHPKPSALGPAVDGHPDRARQSCPVMLLLPTRGEDPSRTD